MFQYFSKNQRKVQKQDTDLSSSSIDSAEASVGTHEVDMFGERRPSLDVWLWGGGGAAPWGPLNIQQSSN